MKETLGSSYCLSSPSTLQEEKGICKIDVLPRRGTGSPGNYARLGAGPEEHPGDKEAEAENEKVGMEIVKEIESQSGKYSRRREYQNENGPGKGTA